MQDIGESVRRQLAGDQYAQKIFRVDSAHGVGKCVLHSDHITLSDGRRVSASELVGTSFQLLTLVNGLPAPVEAFAEWNAIEDVYEIVTESGKRLTRNAEHSLWAATATFETGKRVVMSDVGFRPAGQLQVGDVLAAAEALSAFSQAALSDTELKLLGYLIGDGGFTTNNVGFSQAPGPQLEEFRSCVEELGGRLQFIDRYEYAVRGDGSRKVGSNPVVNLLRSHGLMHAHSRDKRVPEVVFSASEGQTALFLNRLFATDGWASVSRADPGKNGKRGPQREIGFCSASRQLVEDVAYLLQKLGIHGRIWEKPKVAAWVLSIKDPEQQVRFADWVGIYGKEQALWEVSGLARPLAEARARVASRRPAKARWFEKDAHPGTRWERVVKIERRAEQQTVAICVPGHQTFLTQFYEHNTFIAAGLVNWFFDAFTPSTTISTAPSADQVELLLWKDIKS